MDTIMFGLPLGDIWAAAAFVIGAWIVAYMWRNFGASRALPYLIVAGMGFARLALDAVARPDFTARVGGSIPAGAMVVGLALAAIGDLAFALTLYRPRPRAQDSKPSLIPLSALLPLCVILVFGTVPPAFPLETPHLFRVLGIAMLVVGEIVPGLALLPWILHSAKRAHTAP